MVPLLIGGAMALGSAGTKLGRSIKQKREANKLNPVRPALGRTSGSLERENRSRILASSSRLPGQSYYENQIGAQTARTANAAMQSGGSTAEVISGLSSADRSAKDQLSSLAATGAQYKAQNEGLLQGALQDKSAEEMEMFDYNKNQPYQTEMLRKQALIDSSNRNFEGAVSDIGNFGTGLAQGMGSSGSRFGASSYRNGSGRLNRRPISASGYSSGVGLQ